MMNKHEFLADFMQHLIDSEILTARDTLKVLNLSEEFVNNIKEKNENE